MKKAKNIIRLSCDLKFLLAVFALCNLSKATAMFSLVSKQQPVVRKIKPINDLYMDNSTSYIALIQSIEATKREEEKKRNIPSMFSRIIKDPFVGERARRFHAFVMKNRERPIIPESRVKNDIDDVVSLKQSLFLMHEKIKNYTLQDIVSGISYLRIHYPLHNIMDLFKVELSSRGYPHQVKIYENQKINAILNQDIQKMLYVEDAVSLLRDKIILKNAADSSRIKKLAYHIRGFSFNSMVFNSHANELLVSGIDAENNNHLILFQYNSHGLFLPVNDANLEKNHVNSIAISPDGNNIAAVGGNKSSAYILLSSVNNFNSYRYIILDASEFLSVAFRPNSSVIVVLAKDLLISCNIQNGGRLNYGYYKIKSLPDDGTFTSLTVNFDGSQVVVGTSSGRVIVYSFNSENCLERKQHWDYLACSIKAIAFDDDNNRMLVGGDSGEENFLFREHNEREIIRFKVASVSALAFVPGVNRVIMQTSGNEGLQLGLGQVFMDSDSDTPKFERMDLKSPVNGISMAVSPNGAKVVVGFKEKLIVWNLLSPEEEQTLNRLSATLTKDQAHFISVMVRRLQKNNTIKLLPFEVKEYHELPFAVRELLVGTHIGDYSNIN